MVEGKLHIWIKRGEFSHSSDLYVKVMADSRQVWKTDESDSSKPEWNRYVVLERRWVQNILKLCINRDAARICMIVKMS